MAPIITLLSDFGLQDTYVASLKGVILGICPAANLVDVTHLVPPQDVRAGAFLLANIYRDFPPGTVHLAIVDPGVGTDRRGLILKAAPYWFVGPDNGLFSWICTRETAWAAWSLDNSRYWRRPVSSTFHGRDLFAPVAAHLATGIPPDAFGSPWAPQLASWSAVQHHAKALRGEILYIDRFGNVITNLDQAAVNEAAPAEYLIVRVAGRSLQGLSTTYGTKPPGNLLALIGSHGFLEIAVNQGSASALLGCRVGEAVLVDLKT
jgi:S-adenosyl-L-methionine hydrolase (adenosine-forming)